MSTMGAMPHNFIILTSEYEALKARIAELEAALDGPDPDAPEEIKPLSWLRSMIDCCKFRVPGDDCDDPDAYWEMVREVEDLYDRARAALAKVGK